MRMRSLAAAALASTAMLAAGCAEAEKAVNKGGDTPCSEFVEQDADKKRTTVTKFLEQERSGQEAPDDRMVDAAIASIELMCTAQANPDTPIRKADLTGIFVPK
ncbi:hypothetical protein ACFYT3_25360 [Nocardia amikacinitolerans]|uniref:hypothetical protein n=1 Tax=Nocardia amikacinitolerans TaxID=756689 RepID=UPI0020A3C05C|nr:hypothetical protein [Nocardia amikacinitolerans]MCP2289501.1 hypothetical protein [Nocardia amikacinitolerans]